MKGDTGVFGIFAVQSREMFRRLGSARLQLPKGEFVTADPFRSLPLRIDRCKHLGGFTPALDDKGADRTELVTPAFFDDVAGRANPAADRFVEAFEARGRIQHIAERGVLEALAGADIADEGKPAMHADAGMPEFDPARILFGAKSLREIFDVEGCRDRSVGVIGLT